MAYQLLLAKTEVTPGTAPAMTAADSVWAEKVQLKPLGTRVTLEPAKPDLGANPGVITGEHYELTFSTLLVGSGTAGVAPSWGKIALSAGWGETIVEDESVAYAQLADPAASDTMAFDWSDKGRHHKMVWARGKSDIDLTPGQPPRMNWTFRGILLDLVGRTPVQADDADFTDWPTTRPISHDLTTFVLDGENLVLRGLTLNGADNVKFVDLPGQKGAFLRGDPSFSGSIKADVPPIADFNPEAVWIAGAIKPFTATHNTVAGTIVAVSAAAQFDGPSWSEEDGSDVFTSNIYVTTAPSIVLT